MLRVGSWFLTFSLIFHPLHAFHVSIFWHLCWTRSLSKGLNLSSKSQGCLKPSSQKNMSDTNPHRWTRRTQCPNAPTNPVGSILCSRSSLQLSDLFVFSQRASPGIYHKSFILVVQIGPLSTAHDHKWWLDQGLTCKQKDLSVCSKVKLLPYSMSVDWDKNSFKLSGKKLLSKGCFRTVFI